MPDIAERTTNTCSPDSETIEATDFMRSAVPTEVPPNFITFIILLFFYFFSSNNVILLVSILLGDIRQSVLLAFVHTSRELVNHAKVVC